MARYSEPIPQSTRRFQAELAMARQLRLIGRLKEAEAICLRLLAHDERCAEAWKELAAAAAATGHPQVAEHLLARASEVAPSGEVLHDWGRALLRLQRNEEAADALKRAAEALPENAEVAGDLGVALHRLGRLQDAMACYRLALEKEGRHAGLKANLASALKDTGDFRGAMVEYQQALALAPHDFTLRSNLLWTSCHLDDLEAGALYERHREIGRAYDSLWQQQDFSRLREPGRPLKLGFVSADLRNHAAAFFIRPIWRALDRSRFSVSAYSCSPVVDTVTETLKAVCDTWVDASRLDDEALAARIRSDAIDVLFDLSGHTAGNRLPVFARRAAPVQASWIGYPCTTGLAAMDYFLTDGFMAPRGETDRAFAEKIVRMPAAVSFEPSAQLPEVGELPALRQGHLTFGAFHRPAKRTPRTLEAWASLLRQIPGARLLIGHCDDEAAASSLTRAFTAQGVDAARLSFRARTSLPEYLALHREVDIVLDAIGFSGGTTTAHALIMGVPVLTIAGRSMPSRQTGAMLRQLGLDSFVADDVADFVRRGADWAGRARELAELRRELRERALSLPLLQQQEGTRAFERAVTVMWQRWCEGLPPAAFDVSPQGEVQLHMACPPASSDETADACSTQDR